MIKPEAKARARASKSIRKYIRKYANVGTALIVLIAIGIAVLTYICAKVAYMQRGYVAIGGEALIIPMAMLFYAIDRKIRDERDEKHRDE